MTTLFQAWTGKYGHGLAQWLFSMFTICDLLVPYRYATYKVTVRAFPLPKKEV